MLIDLIKRITQMSQVLYKKLQWSAPSRQMWLLLPQSVYMLSCDFALGTKEECGRTHSSDSVFKPKQKRLCHSTWVVAGLKWTNLVTLVH